MSHRIKRYAAARRAYLDLAREEYGFRPRQKARSRAMAATQPTDWYAGIFIFGITVMALLEAVHLVKGLM